MDRGGDVDLGLGVLFIALGLFLFSFPIILGMILARILFVQ